MPSIIFVKYARREDIHISVIYRAININNGRFYIGSTNNLERRKREHKNHRFKDGGAFHAAIIEDGFDAFEWEVLEECDDADRDRLERYYIKHFRDTFGKEWLYNYCDGGKGGVTHDIHGENNPCYGKHKTPEQKKHLSLVLTGRPKTLETREKMSEYWRNRPKSKSAVAKRSHPISVIKVDTGEIVQFPSKSSMLRELHADMQTLKNGKITRTGYKLYENDEGVETIESEAV